MIVATSLSHAYGKDKFAVQNVSFTIPKGTIFGFLGPSGAGKSTVQNIMTGLLKLQTGSVTYDGISVRNLDTKFFNKIGVSFERPNVYPRLTAYENLAFHAGLYRVPTYDPMEVLAQVGLADDARKRAGDFSKGMLQRLNLARALVNKPEILFLDEPTSGLDPATSARIRSLILLQKQRGATIFLTTHNMELADKLCDIVAFLFDGSIAAMDSPENLKLAYGKKEVVITIQGLTGLEEERFGLEDRHALASRLAEVQPVKIHSQEATLEDIFIRVTGRSLS